MKKSIQADEKLDKIIIWKGNESHLAKKQFHIGLYKLRFEFIKNKDKFQLETEIFIQ